MFDTSQNVQGMSDVEHHWFNTMVCRTLFCNLHNIKTLYCLCVCITIITNSNCKTIFLQMKNKPQRIQHIALIQVRNDNHLGLIKLENVFSINISQCCCTQINLITESAQFIIHQKYVSQRVYHFVRICTTVSKTAREAAASSPVWD